MTHYIEVELFRTTVQKLTFAYPLPLTTLYDFSFRNKRYDKIDEKWLPFDENTNGFKRYGRILEKVCVKTYSQKTTSYLLSKPKIYDGFLFRSQKNVYNLMADKIGYKPIHRILPKTLINSAAFLDGAVPDYDAIAKEYPYYIPDKRDGISFLEFILLLNIDLVINKRALKILNNPIVDNKSEILAKNMVNKITKNLRTTEMFEIYVHAFMDVFEQVDAKLHNSLAIKCVEEVWLPEHYQGRKDPFRALNTFLKKHGYLTRKWDEEKQRVIENDDYVHEVIENIEKVSDGCEKTKINELIVNYSILHDIGSKILPITIGILLGEYIEDIEKTDEYILAEQYAEVIKEYIYTSINEVEAVLRSVYVDNNSPLRQQE